MTENPDPVPPQRVSILFIDDELDFIVPLAYWFKAKGYAVTTVDNNEDALKVIGENKPNIIFLDVHLPNIDGFQILKNIRAIDQAVPIIMMSAYVGDAITDKGREYNISGVFYKGADFAQAIKLVDSALKNRN